MKEMALPRARSNDNDNDNDPDAGNVFSGGNRGGGKGKDKRDL